MASTLPILTKTIDDAFVETWYEIRPNAIDNILEATPLWLALREFGCLKTQVGGEMITRTLSYGKKTTQRIAKGTVLTQNEPPLETMGMWQWRYFTVDINRSMVDDQKNSGPFKIKDYVAKRIEAARNALIQDSESKLHAWSTYKPAPLDFCGLFDIVAPGAAITADTGSTETGGAASDYYTSGTSNGSISRANTWWRNQVDVANANYALNLVPDMRTMFNNCTKNQESPNLILCDQTLYEAYEDEASDKTQLVRSSFNKMAADLGYETITFKGATMTWTGGLAATAASTDRPSPGMNMFFLNMNHIEFVYDPNVWFDMTDWKDTPNQLERVAYIVCATSGLLTTQPRRHGYLAYTS
jgi:hypothetical protein